MTDKSVTRGKLCYLRPFERDDISEQYLDWVNDRSATAFILDTGFPITRESLERYVERSMQSDVRLFAICDNEAGVHFGNARLSRIDFTHKAARYGRLVGDQSYRGKGYGTDALIQLLRYGFRDLGLNRIATGVVLDNNVSLRSNDKAGMTREAIYRDFVYAKGRFHDAVELCMLRERFEALYGMDDETEI